MKFTDEEIYLLWAAMAAMSEDVHTPQDNLTVEQWATAELLFRRLDRRVNRAAEQKEGR